MLSDFWKWDQETDTWTQMPDLPGPVRQAAVAISVGNKGYVGTGYGNGYTNLNDFWEFCDTCHVGTNELPLGQGITIYPNPANNYLHILISHENHMSYIEIIDIYGSILLNEVINGNSDMDISSLKAGFYIIKIQESNNFYSTKLIIER